MHLRAPHITTFLLGIALSLIPLRALMSQNIFEVQRSYEEGKLDLNTAMQQQWDLIIGHDHGSDGVKCATPVLMFAHQHNMTTPLRFKADRALSESSSSALRTYLSPSGRFRITYEDSGSNSVPLEDQDNNGIPDYVEEVGIAADRSYDEHVNQIGFIDPIAPGGVYNIEIVNQSGGIYGFTSVRNDADAGTYISIDNDYIGYNPNSLEDQSLGAMRVTVAHEFKHAVQYAANRWRNPSGNVFWSEMDATLMEEIVYDEVNDYYNYIKAGFNSDSPNRFSVFATPSSPPPGSYNYVSWMLYFAERYGMDVFRSVWEQIEVNNSLSIITGLEVALDQLENTTFSAALTENHLWHYYTNIRSDGYPEFGFDERDFYPIADVDYEISSVPESSVEIPGIAPLAARYIEITTGPDDEGVIDLGLDFNSTQIGVGLLYYLENGQIDTLITSGEDKVQLYLQSDYTWQEVSHIGLILTNHDPVISTGDIRLQVGKNGSRFRVIDPDARSIPEDFVINQNFPNPFNPSTTIEFELPESSFVRLQIFSITGQLIQTLAEEDLGAGLHQRVFQADQLASGTYLYRLQIGSDVYIRKMTYIR